MANVIRIIELILMNMFSYLFIGSYMTSCKCHYKNLFIFENLLNMYITRGLRVTLVTLLGLVFEKTI